MGTLDLTAEVQYKFLFKLRDISIFIFSIASFLFQFTMFHNIMRAVVASCQIIIMLFTNQKQVAYPQVFWGGGFVLFYILHSLSGIPESFSIAMQRTFISFLNFIIINACISMVSVPDGFEKFIKYSTFSVIVIDCILIFSQLGTIGVSRLGMTIIYYPVLGRVQYNSNGVGMANSLCVILQSFLIYRDKKLHRLLIMLFMMAVILLTGSRKTLMLVVLGVFMFLFFSDDKHRSRNTIIAGILGVAAIVLVLNVPVLYNVLGNRIVRYVTSILAGEEISESSARGRAELIDVAMDWIRRSPWIGYGLGCFEVLGGEQAPFYGMYSHNNYTELLISGGIPGLVVYYWFYLYVLIRTFFTKGDLPLRAVSLSVIILLPILDYGWVSYCDRIIYFYITICYVFIAQHTAAIKTGDSGSSKNAHLN